MAKTTAKKKEKKEKALVIVESPAKANTIKKMLGENYTIKASFGHIRDFPKKVLGFDVEHDFAPTFQVIPEKKKVVEELNKVAKTVDKVYLAPDPDREGEAIAWHIAQVLKFDSDQVYRIEFNEITKKAVVHAVENPREIDMDRVKAQQTRQILDRLVGYKISPVLWEKLRNNRLSAGRVQSVALRIICEREAEIDAFVAKEYWTITADLSKVNAKTVLISLLTKYQGKKIEINNEKEANEILKTLNKKGVEFVVDKITEKDTTRKTNPPFITSTLQREASSKLGYGVSKTMQVAQKLYEGIELGESGPVGLITYMRTDSTRISDEAQEAAKEFIINHYGADYYPAKPNVYAKKGKNVQDAHEAIRPTYVDKTPEQVRQYLTSEQFRLYKLIWSRFVASQMTDAKAKNLTVEIDAADYTFKLSSSKITFDGFLAVYNDAEDEESEEAQAFKMPDFKKGEVLNVKKIDSKQHFTQPPPRYTEASLVKALEEKGIGRPSTYAPIISKIQTKGYVEKIEKALAPTILGKTVNEQLVKHFENIINYEFTAKMEEQLDDIAEKKLVWNNVLGEFYAPFDETVTKAKENMENIEIKSDQVCPKCGSPMIIKTSRWGTQFLACKGYPECKTALPIKGDGQPAAEEVTDEKCDKCGAPMAIKHGPYGKYLGCTAEGCKNNKKIIVKTGVKCPQDGCEGEIIQKKSRYGKVFYGCDQYPKCNFALWYEPNGGEKCPECGSLLVKKFAKRGNSIACSSKTCKYSRPMPEEEKAE